VGGRRVQPFPGPAVVAIVSITKNVIIIFTFSIAEVCPDKYERVPITDGSGC